MSRVARGDGGTARQRNSGNQGVSEVDGSASGFPPGGEMSGRGRRGTVEVQDPVLEILFEDALESGLESDPLSASWQRGQSESDFEHRDARDPHRISRLAVQPAHDGGVRTGPHEGGQHVGIENDHESKSADLAGRPRHSGRSDVIPVR